jgi:hypothetical protein
MGRVSKGGYEHRFRCPSFETAASRPPQDEGRVNVESSALHCFGLSFTIMYLVLPQFGTGSV